jgi:hypothetical protein
MKKQKEGCFQGLEEISLQIAERNWNMNQYLVKSRLSFLSDFQRGFLIKRRFKNSYPIFSN